MTASRPQLRTSRPMGRPGRQPNGPRGRRPTSPRSSPAGTVRSSARRSRASSTHGYVEHEYVAAGTATSYRAEGAPTGDGRWTFAPDHQRRYRTRVVVRRPEDRRRLQRHRRRRVAERERRVRRRPRLRRTTHEEIDARRRRLGRCLGAGHRRGGRAGGRERRRARRPMSPAKDSRESTRLAMARSTIPATGIRSTSTRRSRTGAPRGRRVRSAGPSRSRCSRRRVAVGIRARHVHQRRAAAHARVRRLLRAQPRAGPACRSSTPGAARRHRGIDRSARRPSCGPTRTCPCSSCRPRAT